MFAFLLCTVIFIAFKLKQTRGENSAEKQKLHRKFLGPTLSLFGAYSTLGLAYWISMTDVSIFFVQILMQVGNVAEVWSYMLLAWNLTTFDEHLIEEHEGDEENLTKKRRTPWHTIMMAISVTNALVWILVLGLGDKTNINNFGETFTWTFIIYFTMYKLWVALS